MEDDQVRVKKGKKWNSREWMFKVLMHQHSIMKYLSKLLRDKINKLRCNDREKDNEEIRKQVTETNEEITKLRCQMRN